MCVSVSHCMFVCLFLSVFICVCFCNYVYVYLCVCVSVYICMYIPFLHVSVSMYMLCLCVCVCIDVFSCMSVCLCVSVSLCVSGYVYWCVLVYLCVAVYLCVCVFMCVSIYVLVCVCVSMCQCVFVCVYVCVSVVPGMLSNFLQACQGRTMMPLLPRGTDLRAPISGAVEVRRPPPDGSQGGEMAERGASSSVFCRSSPAPLLTPADHCTQRTSHNQRLMSHYRDSACWEKGIELWKNFEE